MLKVFSSAFARQAMRPAVAMRAPIMLNLSAKRFYSNSLEENSPVTANGKPSLVRYSNNHEWIAAFDDNTAYIGITKHAADALGETTFVEVVDIPAEVEANDTVGSVESVKSASDLYSPVSGELIEANQELIDSPALVNSSPMGKAWFVKMKYTNRDDFDSLMTLEKYEEFLTNESH